MSLHSFLRLLYQNIRFILGTAIVLATLTVLLTRNMKKVYSSETMINTGLVSGYTLESQDRGNVDRTYTMNELDNILNTLTSRETKEATLERLIALCLFSQGKEGSIISREAHKDLVLKLGEATVKEVLVPRSYELTLLKLREKKNKDSKNSIYALIHGNDELFSLKQLSGIKAIKLGLSDIIRINYSASEPGICHQTLRLLLESFLERYKKIKAADSNNVIEYFERQTAAAAAKLARAEDRLLRFGTENKIINYYEQTRFISAKKEDLDELYQQEVMKQASAKASLLKLESKLDQKEKMSLTTGEIFRLREQITAISHKIITTELDPAKAKDSLAQMKVAYGQVEEALQQKTNALFRMGRTVEGVPMNDILKEWLESVLVLESANGRLEVIEERREEFNRIYEKFAPLGSTLKRIEREIEVCENEYLENLHSLNQAKLHWQNAQLSSNLKIVDEPYFPSRPEPSKRLVLVLASFFSGLILSISLVLAVEFTDSAIKTPERAQLQTGLQMMGAFPRLVQKRTTVDFDFVINRSMEMGTHLLRHAVETNQSSKTILIFSLREGEGKTLTALNLMKKLLAEGNSVNLYVPEGHAVASEGVSSYPLLPIFASLQNLSDWLPDRQAADYTLIEMPALLSHAYPMQALAKVDLALMVTAAARSWGAADRSALQIMNSCLPKSAMLWLNGCRVEALESTVGEIPKKRSYLRRFFKRISRLQLKSNRLF